MGPKILGGFPCFSQNRAALKGTNLRGRTPICGFLQVPAVFCGFLRKSAVSCANLRFSSALFSRKRRESARISENQRKGSVCPLRLVHLSAPTKTSTKYFCDTIATSIARYEKYRCWASKPPRIFSLCRTFKIARKERQNSQKKTRKFLAMEKARTSKKARKGRSGFATWIPAIFVIFVVFTGFEQQSPCP